MSFGRWATAWPSDPAGRGGLFTCPLPQLDRPEYGQVNHVDIAASLQIWE